MNKNQRKCSQCGTAYDVRRDGVGGSLANDRDRELFPHNGTTGVRAENNHWFYGAFCSDDCYADAYYEPPMPGYNW